ncbi:hypothetical protein AD947_08900 [Acetobacter tropicalis]|uniref:Uncharacterized protein n=1 Tax=Acetobacter tropicalis TaxID=104102 RepID=A0A149TW27_9PROT|nr:hypothetical protein [Acetobacter tropicalis]KXV57340.1 hypothetical protein AD947_08900 [Acetobacter tropicalis]
MPDTASTPLSRPAVPAARRRIEKRHAVYKRMAQLAAAAVLAYLSAHFIVMHAVLRNGVENRAAITVAEAVATAALPLLLLLGYGARTHGWGLWVLLVLCGLMAVCNFIMP